MAERPGSRGGSGSDYARGATYVEYLKLMTHIGTCRAAGPSLSSSPTRLHHTSSPSQYSHTHSNTYVRATHSRYYLCPQGGDNICIQQGAGSGDRQQDQVHRSFTVPDQVYAMPDPVRPNVDDSLVRRENNLFICPSGVPVPCEYLYALNTCMRARCHISLRPVSPC